MKKLIYLLLIITLIISIGFLSYEFYFKKKNKPLQTPKIVNKPRQKTEEELKLEKLGNIHKKITFFKKENLDKYLEYKEKHPELTDEMVVVYVNIGLYRPFFQEPQSSPYKHENIVLANKYYFLGSDYVPKDLTTISSRCAVGTHKLTKDAAQHFEQLCNQAIKEGYSIKVRSAYRSYSLQGSIYNNYVNNDGRKTADRYSARAGYSEHQTGLAADLSRGNGSFLHFGKTKEYQWMQKNAYKFGFILRYTKENEPITGYMQEPWHYRYVGLEIAKYIHENPMTYEEYFVRFLEQNKN